MGMVHLILGGNLGDRKQFLDIAIDLIEAEVGEVIQKSSIYETESWGFNAHTAFLNQVVRVETQLSPHDTLARIKQIETQLGRTRGSDRYESRVIDIDILMFDDLHVEDEGLQIPHPRMHLRMFTLVPLAEIAGTGKHPVLKVDINTLKQDCPDDLKVEIFTDEL